MNRCNNKRNLAYPSRAPKRVAGGLAAALVLAAASWLLAQEPASQAQQPQDILVIAHESFPLECLSFWELRALYTRKMQNPSGAEPVTVLNAKTSTLLRREFRKRLLGMSQVRERRYWEDRKVIRGETPPLELIEPPDALLAVKNGISYVFRRDMPKGPFKVLFVLPVSN